MTKRLKVLFVGGSAFFLSGSALGGLPATAGLDPPYSASDLCAPKSLSGLIQRLVVASAVAAPASQARTIPLYPDLAAHPFQLTTSTPEAKAWFSQGLLLTYGFNHSGAVASFRKAQAADPACALCWWGEALALGPNINAPMDARDRPAALAALRRAQALAANAPPENRP